MLLWKGKFSEVLTLPCHWHHSLYSLFKKECATIFSSDCTILHSHKQCMNVAIAAPIFGVVNQFYFGLFDFFAHFFNWAVCTSICCNILDRHVVQIFSFTFIFLMMKCEGFLFFIIFWWCFMNSNGLICFIFRYFCIPSKK